MDGESVMRCYISTGIALTKLDRVHGPGVGLTSLIYTDS